MRMGGKERDVQIRVRVEGGVGERQREGERKGGNSVQVAFQHFCATLYTFRNERKNPRGHSKNGRIIPAAAYIKSF